MPPIPKPEPWWPKNRGIVLAFVAWVVLANGYNYLADIYERHIRPQRFIPYLTAANPVRRQVGLLPLSPDFELSFYSTESRYSRYDAFYHLKKNAEYPEGVSKVIAVNSDTGQWLSEEDTVEFIAADTIKTAYGPVQAAMSLTREYSFERARAKQPPWAIVLVTGTVKVKNPLVPQDSVDNALSVEQTDSSLTYQQADSLIRLWRTRSARPPASH